MTYGSNLTVLDSSDPKGPSATRSFPDLEGLVALTFLDPESDLLAVSTLPSSGSNIFVWSGETDEKVELETQFNFKSVEDMAFDPVEKVLFALDPKLGQVVSLGFEVNSTEVKVKEEKVIHTFAEGAKARGLAIDRCSR